MLSETGLGSESTSVAVLQCMLCSTNRHSLKKFPSSWSVLFTSSEPSAHKLKQSFSRCSHYHLNLSKNVTAPHGETNVLSFWLLVLGLRIDVILRFLAQFLLLLPFETTAGFLRLGVLDASFLRTSCLCSRGWSHPGRPPHPPSGNPAACSFQALPAATWPVSGAWEELAASSLATWLSVAR